MKSEAEIRERLAYLKYIKIKDGDTWALVNVSHYQICWVLDEEVPELV